MKLAYRIASVTVLLCATAAMAQPAGPPSGMPPMVPIAGPAQPGALPLYAGGAPALKDARAAEQWASMMDEQIVRNVTQPTITPHLPDPAKATGAAVIVAPGGAFLQLSMKYEGSIVAKYLADRGIAAFVLKYRLEPTPIDEKDYGRVMDEKMGAAARSDTANTAPPAFQPSIDDGLAAMRFVRANASKYGVDPGRVGMVGFSAGAMTALGVTLANQPGARPDFVGLIYGPMTEVAVPDGAPPLFAAIAADDPLFGRSGFGIVDAWRKARRPVELHVYQTGGHGFGMHDTGTTTVLWSGQFVEWLKTNRLLVTKRD